MKEFNPVFEIKRVYLASSSESLPKHLIPGAPSLTGHVLRCTFDLPLHKGEIPQPWSLTLPLG